MLELPEVKTLEPRGERQLRSCCEGVMEPGLASERSGEGEALKVVALEDEGRTAACAVEASSCEMVKRTVMLPRKCILVCTKGEL